MLNVFKNNMSLNKKATGSSLSAYTLAGIILALLIITFLLFVMYGVIPINLPNPPTTVFLPSK